jgi:hypothetical protein
MVKFGYNRRAKFACKSSSGTVTEYRNEEPATFTGVPLDLDVCRHCGLDEEAHTSRKLYLGLWHGVNTHEDGRVRELSFKRQELTNLKGFEALAAMKSLEHIDLTDNGRLTSIAQLRWLTQLKSLDLMGCSAIADLSPLGHLVGLQELILPAGIDEAQFKALKKELPRTVVI